MSRTCYSKEVNQNSKEIIQFIDKIYSVFIRRRRISDELDENDSQSQYQTLKRFRLSAQSNSTNEMPSPILIHSNDSEELTKLATHQKSFANNNRIITDTILQNRDFQQVLVENSNKMLEAASQIMSQSSSLTIPAPSSSTGQCQSEPSISTPTISSNDYELDSVNDRSLQEQLDVAMKSIIQSTEKNPIFHEVLLDVCANQTQTNEQLQQQQHEEEEEYQSMLRCSTPQNSDDSIIALDIPIKERLRKNRVKSYAEESSTSVKSRMMRKKSCDVKVLSDERYTGPLSADVINCITSEHGTDITTTISGMFVIFTCIF